MKFYQKFQVSKNMIYDYDPNSVYRVFEIGDNSQKFKIGEIENNVFYDVDKNGKRIERGTIFSNTQIFWSQFGRVKIEKRSRPLHGFEPIAWGAYWTISGLISIVLIVGADGIHYQIVWLVVSVLHYVFTIKHRYNKYVVYWMALISIIFILILFVILSTKKTKT